jgi:hypothetical protein|tara:strand:- start:1764 stop:2051 length:288 start_codon:yes stop_codon:yes gene_type:complete
MTRINNSNLKLKVGSEHLYFDVDEFMQNIEILSEDKKTVEVNVPKFEFFKVMLDTVCGIVEDVDENLGVVSMNKLSVPYKLSLNTLIKYNIIKKL